MLHTANKTALLMIDIQNDFCPGGSLAVPDGDAIVPLANALQKQFDVVVATQDWHPKEHASFAVNNPGHQAGEVISLNGLPQVMWPAHCMQETHGAQLHPDLDTTYIQKIIYKGEDKDIDSYSAFFDNAQLRATGLADYLREQNVKEVFVIGLATDFCVKYSCLDAVKSGFKTHVILSACRGIDLQKGDIENAIAEMRMAGVEIIA